MTWARRLKRVFGIDIETSPACSGAVKTIACIEDPVVIEKTLSHLDKKGAVTETEAAAAAGYTPMVCLVSYAISGVPNEVMGEGPIPASEAAIRRAGPALDQMDVIESDEAFAAQPMAVSKGLGLDVTKTKLNGGAIAMGHPVGCSGAFIATNALYELQRTGGRCALVTMCIGGGQGIAAVFDRM